MPFLTHLNKRQKVPGQAPPVPYTSCVRALVVLLLIVFMMQSLVSWPVLEVMYAQNRQHTQISSTQAGSLFTTGAWNAENGDGSDLVYTVAFSRAEQPDGPLVVYRASGADLRTVVPVFAMQRSPLLQTPLLFPSPDGRYLALLEPMQAGYGANLNGGLLSIISTAGLQPANGSRLLAEHVALADQVVWSADSRALYYHSGVTRAGTSPARTLHDASSALGGVRVRAASPALAAPVYSGFDEIHRVNLAGDDVTLFRQMQGDTSLRLVGIDRAGMLILTLARSHMPVMLLRLNGAEEVGVTKRAPAVLMTLPPDILPGNVLGSDGVSVECERVLTWQPLRYTFIRIAFADGSVTSAQPPFDTSSYSPLEPTLGRTITALARSADGETLVMAQVVSTRTDLAAQGIDNVPAQENLILADTRTGALQVLTLPYGGQIVQAFWTPHRTPAQLHSLPQDTLAQLLAFRKRLNGGPSNNASVFQQDEWMLDGHANRLFDGPALPSMCYGLCATLGGAPHVSAAILHGVAYTESNWHQFNSPGYQVNGEAMGTPVESWDGGWGEYQQTWGMPPQCSANNTCRSDALKIEHDQSYNIGVGIQSLINGWNNTASVASQTDPNDPYKANDWFFAVWAYNGSYSNNPADVPSSQYAHWYPGAPFRAIYEEYVWYFAAHPQFASNGWTDNYLPSLGTALLPPQADFANTSDSFVACISCTIPDWTAGSYDREWVGMGAPDSQTANDFTATFAQLGGESVMGLPRDNGGGAPMHRWDNGWVQDFGGGSDLPGALMLADGTTTPYWVHGGVWLEYLNVDHGTNGCHAYPTSNLSTFVGSGSDTYVRQAFQHGYIVWDATTNRITADACS